MRVYGIGVVTLFFWEGRGGYFRCDNQGMLAWEGRVIYDYGISWKF